MLHLVLLNPILSPNKVTVGLIVSMTTHAHSISKWNYMLFSLHHSIILPFWVFWVSVTDLGTGSQTTSSRPIFTACFNQYICSYLHIFKMYSWLGSTKSTTPKFQFTLKWWLDQRIPPKIPFTPTGKHMFSWIIINGYLD